MDSVEPLCHKFCEGGLAYDERKQGAKARGERELKENMSIRAWANQRGVS